MTACKASIVKANGVMRNGMVGARGYRAHCPGCGFLSEVRDYFSAHYVARRHGKAKA